MRDDKLCPVEIAFLSDVEAKQEMLSMPEGSEVVLICAENMIGFIGCEDLLKDMQAKYQLSWIKQPIANPTQLTIIDAVKEIGANKPEIIFAIGGGSAIDTAKGISIFYDFVKENDAVEALTESIVKKTYQDVKQPIPIVAVPTTAGTGSEVTKWATIWDHKGLAKYSIDLPVLYPQKAFIVTEFTMSLPKKLVLSTALDAMAHAMEAFWSKQTSPVVRDISITAVTKIHKYLPLALDNLQNKELREQLCRASLLAGIAFSNTRTTACHSISYPITMGYRVDHGLAAALTLDPVSKINLTVMPAIQELLDIFAEDGGLKAWMQKVSADIQPISLSAFHITKEDVDHIVEGAFTQGRMNNNPVDLSKEQVKEILLSVLS